MNDNLFNRLIDGVSICKDHPNFFLYDGNICKLVSHGFPACKDDYAIESLREDRDGIPYIDIPLLSVDPNKLKMLVEMDISLENLPK